MRLEERLREILQASSGHYKIGLNQLKVDFDKLDDGTIKEGSINFEVIHYLPRNQVAFTEILKSIDCASQIIEEMDKNQKPWKE